MSGIMRGLLFAASLLTAIYIQRKLKKSQMRVADAIFWIVFSIILVVLGLFPTVCIWFARKLGFIAPVNFVFLVTIFLLVIRCFILSVQLSNLEGKFETLVEESAVRENMRLGKEAAVQRAPNGYEGREREPGQ